MTLRVEERPVAQHMALWHSLLAQTRERPVEERTLAWRYLHNPHGVARAWVLVDDASGEVAGFTVVMPRRMSIAGRSLSAWIGADFSILPPFRALGPALQLRRAAREAIDRGEADLLYSFPNERMVLIHERAGHVRLGDLRRFARPASLRPHLTKALGSRVAATVLAPAADMVQRLDSVVRSMGERSDLSSVTAAQLDDNTTRDAAEATRRLTGAREARYLQWRYEGQPGWRGGIVAAARNGRQTGYLIYTEEAELLHISDLIAVDSGAASALMRVAWRIASRRNLASVSIVGLERGPWDDLLTSLGYQQRDERHAVYAYVPDRHRSVVSASEPAQWHLTVGDRDI